MDNKNHIVNIPDDFQDIDGTECNEPSIPTEEDYKPFSPSSPDDEIMSEMLEVLTNIVNNAQVQPDASMAGTTDCYAVPLDDIEQARLVLGKAISMKKKQAFTFLADEAAHQGLISLGIKPHNEFWLTINRRV